MEGKVIISHLTEQELAIVLTECEHDKFFVLTDENTCKYCWPVIRDYYELRDACLITIPAEDTNKNVETLSMVWKVLSEKGATRHSCLINLGGGMVTDLGGFAAATFKRGINFINIPTTLLAMVDASVGGKTGVNFGGLKNEIGAFRNPIFTLIDTNFLKTLDMQNICSGFAEMIKHGLISDNETWAELIEFNIENPDMEVMEDLVRKSVAVKQQIVEEDPLEKGIRKALNLGHTVGHALESWVMAKGRPILHGYAVAYGLTAELFLSSIKTGFPTSKLHATARRIKEIYGSMAIKCDDYDDLINLMRHDKKNIGDTVNFTLLADVGDIKINQTATENEIKDALDYLLF